MKLDERNKSIDFINNLNLRHIVIGAEPLPETMRPERARRKCLETLLPILEKQYDITQLFMESRNTKQDLLEINFIQGIRSRGFISSLNYQLLPGDSDARLWIPDQILGAVGADDWRGLPVKNVEQYMITLE
ncbi:MAG: hypothetical protein J6575_05910 [Bifidobacterium sp.]|nr:hypothetical protein [Bifidobacterium sp.]